MRAEEGRKEGRKELQLVQTPRGSLEEALLTMNHFICFQMGDFKARRPGTNSHVNRHRPSRTRELDGPTKEIVPVPRALLFTFNGS